MGLHRAAQQMLADTAASGRLNAHLLPVEVARDNFENDFGELKGPPLAVVTDVAIPVPDGEMRARLYHAGGERPRPLVVYFHGGGWLLGSIDTHDFLTRKLALASGCAVLSVDYRRGPDAKFPIAVDDSIVALNWAFSAALPHVDVIRLAVAGDSAGGNLVAALALHARDAGGPQIMHQLLVYPVTTCDLALGFDDRYEGVMLYRDEMQWHQDNYLNSPGERFDTRVSPLGAALAGLPPATVVLAECDPIRPQGELYAQTLSTAGVPVTVREFPGMVHGFFGLDQLFPDEAAAAMGFASDQLRAALGEQA